MPFANNGAVRLNYEVVGDGPTIMLIHANPFDRRLWRFQVEDFSDRYRMIAIDLRGYGASDKPDDAFSFEDMVADVLAVCDAAGVGRAVFIGASVGSSLALRIALDDPDRVSQLVLIGGNAGVAASGKARIAGYAANGIAYHTEHIHDLVATGFADTRRGKILIDNFLRDGGDLNPATIANVFRAMEDRDMTDRLSSLSVPTLVVNGEHDLSLAGGRRTAELAPGARHVVLPGAGHVCNYEDPDAFNDELRVFLEGAG
ncbi:MAG: alpha/beta fold hydrolase [Alphaproteobacteria bacterium]